MQPQDIEIIATQILFDAKSALKGLQAFNAAIDEPTKKIAALKQIIIEVAKQANVSFTQAAAAVAKLGNQSGINPQAIRGIGKELESAKKEAGGLGDAGKKSAETMQGAFERTFTAVNALRIALGAIISMILFQLIQAFTTFFTEASKQARQLEDTLYRLSNVERSLSMEGIEISLKGLEDGITRIQKKLPIFSREDVSQLVGTLAISTKQLGLTEKQILDLAEAVSILNVRSEKQEDLSVTAQHVLSSLLTGNARGMTSLGIAFTDSLMTTKALELGYLKAGESLSALTENEKGLTKLAIILESTGQEYATINEYLETNTAKIQANEAAWKDLLTTIGQGINNLIPNLVPVFEKFQKSVELSGVNKLFKEQARENFEIKNTWLDATIWSKIGVGVKLTTKEYERLKSVLESIPQNEILKIFPDPSAIKDRFTRELIQSIVEIKDTATNLGGITGAPQIDEEQQAENEQKAKEHGEKLAEIMQDNADKLEDIERQYQQKIQDINRDYSNKLSDIARDSSQKREDAARDYYQKIEDVNRNATEQQAEAQADFRKKEIDREAEYQRKLRELREKFLFDLEDALRERDARQVLRLIRQYQMDKRSLEDKRKLDAQDAKKTLADKLAEIERERQLKLEQAKREYDEKLKEIAIGERRAMQEARIWLQRQLLEARLWHQRQLQEQQEYLKRKLEDLRKAYEQELKMAGTYGSAITKALSPTGTTTTAKTNPLSGGVSTGGFGAGFGSGYYNPYDIRARAALGFAEGGTLVAKRPTLAVFGEKEPEIASFKPIGRSGKDVNKIFGDMNIGSDIGGFLNIAMSLSPDLEARVVESSLEHVAVHVERMTRG